MLKRIRIDNFRCLVDFDLCFDSINLFIGNNGVGKSQVFEVLLGLQILTLGFSKVEGVFNSLSCTRWQNIPVQFFELHIDGNGGNYIYSLWIEHNSKQSYIQHEKLSFQDQPLLDFKMGNVQVFDDSHKCIFNYPSDWSQSILPLIPASEDNKKLTWFRKRMGRFINVKIVPTQMSGSSDKEEYLLSPYMENYISWYRYHSQDQEKVVELRNCLKEILDGFVGFKFEPLGNNKVLLDLRFSSGKEKNNIIAYDFRELSDGQKVLIALYTLIYCTKSEDYTLCLDEPENFLALPEIQPWLITLYDLCAEGEIQALLISHHPRLIDYLVSPSGELPNNYLFERGSNKAVKVRKISHQETDDSGLKISELIARGWV